MKRINRLLMQIEPREYQYITLARLGDDGLLHTTTNQWAGVPGHYDQMEGVYTNERAIRAWFPGEHLIIIDNVPTGPEVGSVAEQA